jgi:hypothetical protein
MLYPVASVYRRELEKDRHRGGGVLKKLTVLEAWREGKLCLPPGYDLEHEADLMLLRREDGILVAAFGVDGTTPSGVTTTAWEDYKFTRRSA